MFLDPKQMECLVKISIHPRNWAESTINVDMSTEGKLYSSHLNAKKQNGIQGTQKLSASLMIINVTEPSPRFV